MSRSRTRASGPRRLTEAGRAKLRETALRNRPWQYSTGPITEAGKQRSSQNGRFRQRGLLSERELNRVIAGALALVVDAAALRKTILRSSSVASQNAV